MRVALVKKAFKNVELEWMRCSLGDVKTVLTELRTGQTFTGPHSETFPMRREQSEAVERTHGYFHSIWGSQRRRSAFSGAARCFGKTFTTYQLAKLVAKRVLMRPSSPPWRTPGRPTSVHVDFEGWQYLSRHSDQDPSKIEDGKPVVYFGSFQDLLGRDKLGNIKPKNKWIYTLFGIS